MVALYCVHLTIISCCAHPGCKKAEERVLYGREEYVLATAQQFGCDFVGPQEMRLQQQ